MVYARIGVCITRYSDVVACLLGCLVARIGVIVCAACHELLDACAGLLAGECRSLTITSNSVVHILVRLSHLASCRFFGCLQVA